MLVLKRSSGKGLRRLLMSFTIMVSLSITSNKGLKQRLLLLKSLVMLHFRGRNLVYLDPLPSPIIFSVPANKTAGLT